MYKSINIRLLLLGYFIIISSTACQKQNPKIKYSPDEQQWINSHNAITLAVDDTYPPLNFKDKDGNLTGLNIDLIRLIESRIGVKIILDGSNWNVALDKAMNHKVDGIINAAPLEERKKNLNFSEGFFRDPMALVCHTGNNSIDKFSDLKSLKVAAKKDSRQLQILKSEVPEVEIIEINTLLEGIEQLSMQKIDAVFDDLAPIYHIISTQNFNNVKVAFINENSDGSMIGVRNDDPVLLSIFNKAIKSVTEKEKLAIRNKWIQINPERDYARIYIGFGILLALLFLIGLWSFSMRLLVKKKTKELSLELKRREQTEIELITAKEKAEQSDKLKSAFLANVSHEIRTPLNAIIGFSTLLIDTELKKSDKEYYGTIIRSSSNSLLGLINDIVDFAKIEAGFLEIRLSKIPIDKIFAELKPIYEKELAKVMEEEEKDIHLITNIDNNLVNINLQTDELRLKQIISILLNNAIKFSAKGTIEVGCKIAENNNVQFYVRDTGIGIDEKDHDIIFKRFQKIEDHSTSLYRGAGLGLSIAKHLVLSLGGKIWVESTLGNGATFIFTQPVE